MPAGQAAPDVAILGGGLAGLTLALQLVRERPATRVVVVERARHPVPETAHKVGESTIEAGSFYLAEMLGLRDLLRRSHLRKLGLRFFFSEGDNRRIERRVELGSFRILPVTTWQLERGRFENELVARCASAGVEVRTGELVRDVRLGQGDEPHRVLLESGELRPRWLVDATGVAGLVKRRQGLALDVAHPVSSGWFHLGATIDIDRWSGDADWVATAALSRRRFATNHLVGRGYWVWIIPLRSGATSVGLVLDERAHDVRRLAGFQGALDWLHEHEPQLAEAVEACRGTLLRYRVRRRFAHACEQVFSPRRWAVTGEAGVFADPLYSIGTDLIAYSNTLIADLVRRDLAGEDIAARADAGNRLFLDYVFDVSMNLYLDQYATLGCAPAMLAKAHWDYALYWGQLGLLFTQGRVCDLAFLARVAPQLEHLRAQQRRMQRLFRDWAARDERGMAHARIGYSVPFLFHLQRELTVPRSDEELVRQIRRNVGLLDELALRLFEAAAQRLGLELPRPPVRASAVGLDPAAWEADGLFEGVRPACELEGLDGTLQALAQPAPRREPAECGP